MIKPSRKTFYLILAVNILLIVAIGLLLWQINEEKAKLAKTLAQTPTAQSAPDNLLGASLVKLEPQLSALDNYFLSASTTVEFLECLDNTAKLAKVNFKINQAEAKDNLQMTFSAQDNFSAVNQFLTLFEKFPYALRIDRLDLRAGDKGVWKEDFAVTVKTQ